MTEIGAFAYELPEAAIAQRPVEPRHGSRLLDTRDLGDHRFLDLPDLLRPGDLVVVNRTRVRHGRLRGHKVGTGGAVEALLVRRLDERRWEALVKPARRLRPGVELRFGPIRARLVGGPTEGVALLEMDAEVDVEEALARTGAIPLPPYIHEELEDPARYQTMFAERPGSAAAPTAGLHFTPEVVARLLEAGMSLASVDLEVGLATFRPILAASVEEHRMHREAYHLDEAAAAAVAETRRRRGRVVAIGTTVARVLETRARDDGTVVPAAGETDLYLRPGVAFRCVDLLVTNFHLPRSSLLVLVEAFMGPGWRAAYETALARDYRFLSFGDAMLAERAA